MTRPGEAYGTGRAKRGTPPYHTSQERGPDAVAAKAYAFPGGSCIGSEQSPWMCSESRHRASLKAAATFRQSKHRHGGARYRVAVVFGIPPAEGVAGRDAGDCPTHAIWTLVTQKACPGVQTDPPRCRALAVTTAWSRPNPSAIGGTDGPCPLSDGTRLGHIAQPTAALSVSSG